MNIKVSTLINHNDCEGQPSETIRHVLARDHPRPSTREDLRRSRSTSLGQTGLCTEVFGIMLCILNVSFPDPLLYKIFMFWPRYMRPASAISWGCWLRPGGHSSNVDNLGKTFSHPKQGKAGNMVLSFPNFYLLARDANWGCLGPVWISTYVFSH